MLRRSGTLFRWPMRQVGRKILPFVPLVVVLGLLTSLLEGAGIGLLIPLLSVLLAEDPGTGLPAPLRTLAFLFDGYDAQARVTLLGTAIFALVLMKGVVQAANESLLGWLQARLGRDVRNGIAGSLLAVDYPFFLNHDLPRLTRIAANDSWSVIQVSQSVLRLIPAAAGLLVFTVLLALLDLELLLVVIVGGAVIQGLIYYFERAQRQLSYEQTEGYRQFWQRMLTLLHAPRAIRLFGQQDLEREKAIRANERLRHLVQKGNHLNAFVHPAVDLLIALLLLAVLLAGYWKGMSIPEITAFILLLTRAQPHAKTISQARLGIASLHGSVREVDWLLSRESRLPAKPTEPSDLRLDRPIHVERLSYAYANGSRALDDVTLTIEPEIATALIGPSGSGKTTLVNLLCRLLEPDDGEIRLGETPIAGMDIEAWRGRIAVAGQDAELVIGTVGENIAYGRPGATRAEIEDSARSAGAHKFIAGLPEGYDTRLGPDGLSLSGGQRQRIALARALLRHPDLLILDEATSAVDALTEAEIMTLIAEHRHFRTMLVISHRKTTIAACQRGIVLDHGVVAETGRLSDLEYFQRMAGPSVLP